jgi:hypothetical protein
VTDTALSLAVLGFSSQAKGEIQGSQTTLFRSRQPILHGKGFYEEIKPGEILVTSGLDGVFPEGLAVAKVIGVFPMAEGASSYDLEATLAAGDLDHLKFLTVLPSLGVDEEW